MTSAKFDTDYHVDLAKAIPLLKEELFGGKVAQSDDEGVIHAGEWDSDAFSLDFVSIVGIFNVGEDRLRRSIYGLQTASNTHFDKSNIRGSTEVARKRYENGLSNLFSTTVDPVYNNKPGNDDLTGRGFSGEYAGVQNMLYRFGQILHSYQDFYSHSNWVEMARVDNGKWQLKDKLLDSSYDLPKIIKQGDFIPGTNVMIADDPISEGGAIINAEGEDLGRFKPQGYGSDSINPFATKSPFFWQVASTSEYNRQINELYTFTTSDKIVGGIASGGLDAPAYRDDDLNPRMRDERKTGAFQQEYFSGFGHGGLAGNGSGKRVGNLNKDKNDNPLYSEAMDFARKQSIHEFDRMAYMIYARHGLPGLQHFAEYAINPGDIPEFLKKYSGSAPSSYSQAAASNQLVNNLDSALVAEQVDDHRIAINSNVSFRRLIAFDGAKSDSRDFTYYLIDQAKKPNTKAWFDLASVHGVHDDPDLTPASVSHLDLGLRGYWAEASSSGNARNSNYIQDDALTYFIENKNRDASVYLNNFRVGKDSIAFVGKNDRDITYFTELTYDNYSRLKSKLHSLHNVILDAVPFAEQQDLSVVIQADTFTSDIDLNGTLVIRADQFFGDLDDPYSWGHSGSDDSLRFSDYDQSLPWLRLDYLSGNLIVDSLHPAYPDSGSFSAFVRVSDRINQLDEQELQIELNPTVSLGSGFQFDSDITFKATPLVNTTSAYQVLYGFDEPGPSEESLYPLFTALGSSAGSRSQFNDLSNLTLSDDDHSGELMFYGRDLAEGSLELLSWEIAGDSRVILSDSSGNLFALDPLTNSSATAGAIGQGFNAPTSASLPVGYGLPVAQTDFDHSIDEYRYELSYTLHSDMNKTAKIGFMLMDSLTGSVYDPRRNDYIDQPADLQRLLRGNGRIHARRFEKAVSLYSRTIEPNSTLSTTFQFDFATPMLQERVRVVPFVRYKSGDYGYASSQLYIESGQLSGIVASPNSLGFERTFGANTDSDYGDLSLIITDLKQLV